jgi:hypothetical protein
MNLEKITLKKKNIYYSGATMAVEAVKKNPDILPGYQLELLLDDGQCKADIVMKIFIEYVLMDQYKKLIGILGKRVLKYFF